MRTARWATGITLLAGLFPLAGVQAAEPEAALCRGPYPVMLMTERECRLYVQQVRALQSAGQARELAILQQQHIEQLSERAAACSCVERSAQIPASQHVAMLEPDC